MTDSDIRDAVQTLAVSDFPGRAIERRTLVIRRRRRFGKASLVVAVAAVLATPFALRREDSQVAIAGDGSPGVTTGDTTSTGSSPPAAGSGIVMEILPVRIPPGSTLSGATPSALVVSTEGVTTVMPLGGGPQSTLPTLQQVIAVAPGSPSLAVGIGTDTNKLHIIGFDGISNFEPIPIVGPFVAAFAGHHLLVVDSERSHVIDVQTGARSDASLPASVPPTAKVRSAVGTIAGAVTVLWEDEAAVMLDGTPTYLLRQWSSDTNSFAELAAPAETQSGRLLLATTTTELLLLNERDVTVGAERWRETWVYRRGPGEEWLGSMVGERHHTCPVRLAATDRLTLTVICGQPYLALDGRWVDDKPPGELRGQATDGASLIGAFADGSVVRWS